MLNIIGIKLVAMVMLSAGSYICGILPMWLGLMESCAHSLLLSLVLCYGGGVLFATSLLHIMPEARRSLPGLADMVLCAGFMFLYLIEEINKIFDNRNYRQECKLEVESLLDGTVHHRYNTISNCKCRHEGNMDAENAISTAAQDIKQDESNVVVSTQNNNAVKNRFGLLLAFTVHSVIEGVAIGIQPLPGKVLLLMGAVLTHKLVVAFCLGAELASDGRSFASLNRCLTVYAIGSAIGIPFGIAIDRTRSSTRSAIIPVLQALAAGSLLYITVSEILPRERSRWQHQKHPAAGLLQFFTFCLGILTILLLLIFV